MTENNELDIEQIAARQEALMYVICALIQSHPNLDEWRDAMTSNLLIKSTHPTPEAIGPGQVNKYLEWFKALPI